mmetsp:Transcript_3285/g.2740  ORF Transcript_3285/g.2740 Transcript_3285/m.2740 type:complete len:284 (+) Transcript_3285:8-859(+)
MEQSSKFDELTTKVKEFVKDRPTESALIGATALAVVGYLTYKYFWRVKIVKLRNKSKPEDSIKIEKSTPGNPDSEEAKKTRKPDVPVSDSEDEPILLKQIIIPTRDNSGILDRSSLVRIFDKRSTIRGMRKLDKTFKEKRRANFNNPSEYKSIISYYHNEIERRRENNLEYICRSLNINIEDIENSQEKYFGDRNLAFELGTKDFQNIEVPGWLTFDIASQIYDSIKDMLQTELIQLNCKTWLDEEDRELEMAYIQYKVQDTLFFKHKVEEEHIKKVLAENGI